VLIILLSEKTP